MADGQPTEVREGMPSVQFGESAGRVFSVVVHGDAAGSENLRRSLADWLEDMSLIPAGSLSLFDRYVGYLAPYATSHDALDADTDFQEECATPRGA